MKWSGREYNCSLIEGAGALVALRREWDDLQCRSPDAYVSEGAEWAHRCWRARATERGQRLLCFVVRRGPQLVAILPLVVSRRGLFRTAWPLACVTTEYCPLLADPSADTLGIWSAIAGGIELLSSLDAVVLPHVRDGDPLAPFLRRAPNVVETNSFAALLLQRSVFGCWEIYWDQIPPAMRSNLNRRTRRLSELGELRFEELTDDRRMRAAWAWMLSHKRDWLARKGLDHAFIPTNEYSRFIEATLDISGPTGRRAVFALTLNGEFVAATLVNVDRRRVEGVVCAYDPAFAKFGPGQLLTKELVQWAFAHGLDVDFRIGNEDFKREWASHTTLGSTYVLPRNFSGRLFGAYFALRTWVAQNLSPGWRGKVRLMLGLGSASRIKGDCARAAACD